MGKNIAIIGADGQIGSALTALLLDGNQYLDEENKVTVIAIGKGVDLEEKESEDEVYANRFDYMTNNGIKVHLSDQDGALRFIPRNSIREDIEKNSHYVAVSDNDLNTIPTNEKIDHIIIATKAFSHDERLIKTLKELEKNKLEGERQTTTTIAQNGLSKLFLKSLMEERRTLVIGDLSEYTSINDDFIREIQKDKYNYHSCVLNVACQPYEIVKKDGEEEQKLESKAEEDEKLDFCEYFISTPRQKIALSIDHIYHGGRDGTADLQDIRNVFARALLRDNDATQTSDEVIEIEILKKLQVNMINALCTLFGCNIGEIMESSELDDSSVSNREIYMAMVNEVEQVAQACLGHKKSLMNDDNLFLRDEIKLTKRLENSAPHYTSTNIDFEQGKKLEIEALFESIIKVAQGCNVELKVIPEITKAISELEKHRDQAKQIMPMNEAIIYARDQNEVATIINEVKSDIFLSRESGKRSGMEPSSLDRAKSDETRPPSTSLVPEDFVMLGKHGRSTTEGPVRQQENIPGCRFM